jgi:hypothetical protein
MVVAMSGWLLAAIITAQTFDGVTTVLGVRHGCREILVPTQNPWVLGGLKMGAGVAVAITLPKAPGKKLRIGLASAVIGSGVAGGVLNSTRCLAR